MQPTTNPLKQFPGNPRLSIPRIRPTAPPVRLTDTQYRLLAQKVKENLTKGKSTDEIIFGTHCFRFDTETRKTQKEAPTGVEHLGVKETFTRTTITLLKLRLDGVYTLGGSPVRHEVDGKKIEGLTKEIMQ